MVNTKEIPPEAILLGVYLELQNGQKLTDCAYIISLDNRLFEYKTLFFLLLNM